MPTVYTAIETYANADQNSYCDPSHFSERSAHRYHFPSPSSAQMSVLKMRCGWRAAVVGARLRVEMHTSVRHG